MSKTHKKPRKSGKPGNAERRPWEFITLLVLNGIGVLAVLWTVGFYWVNDVVYDSSVGVSLSAFMQYRAYLLAVALGALVCWLLLFFNTKAGYWLCAVSSVWYVVSNLLSLKLFAALIGVLYCYLTFCESTRRWFRIGKFRTLPPRPKQKEKPQ